MRTLLASSQNNKENWLEGREQEGRGLEDQVKKETQLGSHQALETMIGNVDFILNVLGSHWMVVNRGHGLIYVFKGSP